MKKEKKIIKLDFLSSARFQKNFLYVLLGMVMGRLAFSPENIARTDYIILLVGSICFCIETVYYFKYCFNLYKFSQSGENK